MEIKDTLARKDIDLEDKVWKVGQIVFGPPPNEPAAAYSVSDPGRSLGQP